MSVELVLQPDESAIFGYGSLLSKRSMEQSLGHMYQGPFLPAVLQGWERAWNIAMPNRGRFYTSTPDGRVEPDRILYLNVRQRRGAQVNGVIFIVRPNELEEFDKREWIYSRETVNEALQGVRVTGGSAEVYVGLPEYVCDDAETPRAAAIRRSYLDIVASGLADWGPDFERAYYQSTQPVPEHLVILDRRTA